ncbi:MAG TPA: hypothetical protein DER05_02130 [Lutibacter sp.]|nr:hypothetical protein [Lutibacter sp.]
MFKKFKQLIGVKELFKEQVGNYFFYGSCRWEPNNDLNIIDSKKVETIFFLNTYATNSMKLIIESLKGKKEYHLEIRPETKDSILILNVVDFDSNHIKLRVFLNKEVVFFRIQNENTGFYFSKENLMYEKDMFTPNIQKSNKEGKKTLENERLRKFENLINELITINPRFDIIRKTEKYAVLYCNSRRYNFTLKLSNKSDGWLYFEYSANNYANSTQCNIISENLLNFDEIKDAYEFLESSIINRNKLFSINYNPLKNYEIQKNVNLLSINLNSDNHNELQLTFEYGIIINVDSYAPYDEYSWEIIPEKVFVEDDIINLVEDSTQLLFGDWDFTRQESDEKLAYWSNKRFKLNPDFDEYVLVGADRLIDSNFKLEINIQGIQAIESLKKLIDKITSSNQKIKIVEQDELGNILFELFSLHYKFSISLKLNLSNGILKVDYNVYDFSGERLLKLIDPKTVKEFELVDLQDVNHAYDLLVKNILNINEISNINYNPFRSSDHKKSVKLLKISQKVNNEIELVFEYGIEVRFQAKKDYSDFDNPMEPENEIPYKYEVTPYNSMLPDEIEDLVDHCYALIFDYYDQKEVNRILRVNADWEFKLNPDFNWD